MHQSTLLVFLLTTGFCCCLQKRQSERPIREHLIPPILKGEASGWVVEEEELPDSMEKRKLHWLQDAARFGDFPLGTIREIEESADLPTAVVIPAAKHKTLQVARHGPHALVTDEEVEDSPFKFIPHHHPSLRTVDLSDLADEVNLIFAHPRNHERTVFVLPEDNPVTKMLMGLERRRQHEAWNDFEEERAASDGPVNNPLDQTVLVLPEDNPVKKVLKELQDKVKERKEVQPQQTEAHQERKQEDQGDLEQNLQATQSKNQHQQIQENQNQQGRSATFSSSRGKGLILPQQQQPVIVLPIPENTAAFNGPSFREAQQGMIDDARKADPHHLHKHLSKKYGAKVVPQNIIHIYQQQSAKGYGGYQSYVDQNQKVGAPFLVNVPSRASEEINPPIKRFTRSATFSSGLLRPTAGSSIFQQQPGLINRPVVVPQSSVFGQQSAFQQPGFAVVPIGSFFRSNEEATQNLRLAQPNPVSSEIVNTREFGHSSFGSHQSTFQQPKPFFRSSVDMTTYPQGEAIEKSSTAINISRNLGTDRIVPGNAVITSEGNVSASTRPVNATQNQEVLTVDDIERIERTIPMQFPESGGYFPIILATSPNGLPLQKPSDDPGYEDLKRIRPVNITALEEDLRTGVEPLLPRSAETGGLRFFEFANDGDKTRSAEVDLIEDTIGPLSIFEFSNDDDDDEISFVELNEMYPGEMRGANPEAQPHRHHNHGGSHFFVHQHGFIPNTATQHFVQGGHNFQGQVPLIQNQQFAQAAAQSQASAQSAHTGFIPGASHNVVIGGGANSAAQAQASSQSSLGGFTHGFNYGPNAQISGGSSSAAQAQASSQNSHTGFVPGLHPNNFNAGQSVQINGAANSVSQSQTNAQSHQNAFVNGASNSVNQNQASAFNAGQSVQISGAGNSISQSQATSQSFHRIRRSLVELMNDPNVKLDVPKTISNIGTVTKTSFHDQKKPMYHLNNMVGSIKDVIMSTIKIPPQGLVIPSQYRIVHTADLDEDTLEAKHEKTRSINEELLPQDGGIPNVNQGDPFHVVDTFSKVGSAIRESIQAGQQTLSHVGDIAHSARQVVHTAKSNAPQVFLPNNHRERTPDKVMFLAPKVLGVKSAEEGGAHLLQAQDRKDFVKMGDLMDALGVSNPNEENVGIEKIVIHRKGGTRLQKGKPIIVARTKEDDDNDLKGFVSKMKGEFSSLVKDKLRQDREDRKLRKTIKKLEKQQEPLVKLTSNKQAPRLDHILGQMQDHIDIMKSKSDQVIDTLHTVNGKVIDTLRTIGGSKAPPPKDDIVGVTHIILPKNFQTTPRPTARLKSTNEESDFWDKQVSSFLTELFEEKKAEEGEEIVGAPQIPGNGLNLRPDLLKPFMGRASKASLRKFLKKHGDSVEDDEEVVGVPLQQNETVSDLEKEKIRKAQIVLGAVNPLMFEKLFKETMRGASGENLSPYDVFTAGRNLSEPEEQICSDQTNVGTSMKITKELLKPFMGRKGKEYIEVIPVPEEEDYYEKQQQFYVEK